MRGTSAPPEHVGSQEETLEKGFFSINLLRSPVTVIVVGATEKFNLTFKSRK